jgi:hypothetical protein
MGAWGYGVFNDDTAAEVRDEYEQLLREKQRGDAATDALLGQWRETIDDPDDGPVFWLALALTQHKLGRLEARVQREALAVIDRGLGLDRWREQGGAALKRRVAQLAKARAQLESAQPAARKIRPPFRDTCDWKVEELVAYQLKSRDWIVLRIVTHEEHAHGVAPVCEILDWVGAAPPAVTELRAIPARSVSLSPWSLFQFLSRSAPESSSEPMLATNRLLAEIGLLDRSVADYCMSGLLGSNSRTPPPGFDWAGHYKRIESAIERVRAGDPKVRKSLEDAARVRAPKLLNPISQISLRREPGIETLPMRRIKRLKGASPASPPGEWLVIRWQELDEALADIFGLK